MLLSFLRYSDKISCMETALYDDAKDFVILINSFLAQTFLLLGVSVKFVLIRPLCASLYTDSPFFN